MPTNTRSRPALALVRDSELAEREPRVRAQDIEVRVGVRVRADAHGKDIGRAAVSIFRAPHDGDALFLDIGGRGLRWADSGLCEATPEAIVALAAALGRAVAQARAEGLIP